MKQGYKAVWGAFKVWGGPQNCEEREPALFCIDSGKSKVSATKNQIFISLILWEKDKDFCGFWRARVSLASRRLWAFLEMGYTYLLHVVLERRICLLLLLLVVQDCTGKFLPLPSISGSMNMEIPLSNLKRGLICANSIMSGSSKIKSLSVSPLVGLIPLIKKPTTCPLWGWRNHKPGEGKAELQIPSCVSGILLGV